MPFDSSRGRLVRKVVKEALQLVDRLSASEARAIQKQSDKGSILERVARSAGGPAAIDASPLFAARVRGDALKLELIKQAGGLLSAKDAARLLGITTQALHKRYRSQALIAIRTPTGDLGYPAFQFETDSMTQGVAEVLRHLQIEDAIMSLSFMLTALPELGGLTPVAAIRAGRVADARTAATHFGEQGAA